MGIWNSKNSTKNNHPNEKNIELIEFLIKVLSNENDTILDNFMGAGGTGIACKNTNRNFIGIDINKELYELSKKG